MLRTLIACAVTAGLVLAITEAGVVNASSRRHVGFTPACPHATKAADGNMSPLFCVIDDPAALRYFATDGEHTFALGANATQAQVVDAVVADRKSAGTIPILCSIYRLAAWREHWSFGASTADRIRVKLHLYKGWCNAPRFPDIR